MNNDLSDEAFEVWARDTFELRAHKPTWQECRRRALERERLAFEAGFLARNLKNWNSIEAYSAFKEQND